MPRNSPTIFLIIAISLFFFAAGHTSQADDTKRKKEANLTERHAKDRRAQLAGTVNYAVDLYLEKTDSSYSGSVTIKAKVIHTDKPLTLDFTAGKVSKISVNNALLSEDEIKAAYNGFLCSVTCKNI